MPRQFLTGSQTVVESKGAVAMDVLSPKTNLYFDTTSTITAEPGCLFSPLGKGRFGRGPPPVTEQLRLLSPKLQAIFTS